MSRLVSGGAGGVGGIEDKFKFVPIPFSEPEADLDSFVVEFNGVSGANETGTGAGITAPHNILTQYANPGSDGTNRTIQNGTFQSFYGTTEFYNTFVQSPLGWAFAYRCKSLNGTSNSLLRLIGTDASGGGNHAMQVLAFAGNGANNSMQIGSCDANNGLAAGLTLPGNSLAFPVADEAYLFVGSLDYVNGLAFTGLMVDTGVFPTSLGEFLFFSINELTAYDGPAPIAGYAYSNYYKCIVGSFFSYASNYSGGQTPLSLTLSKKPIFTLK